MSAQFWLTLFTFRCILTFTVKLNFDSLAKSYSRFIVINPTHLSLNMQSKHISFCDKILDFFDKAEVRLISF